MLSKNIVTLNIESRDIRFLAIKGRQVMDWGSVPLAAGFVKQGFIAEPAKVSSTINALFSEKEMPRRGVAASLIGLRSVLRIFSLPKLKSSLLEEAIQHESEREMPVPLQELYVSQQFLGAEDSQHQFLVLGVPRELLDSEVQTLSQSGIELRTMNLKPLALARAVGQQEALIINMELDAFDLVGVLDGIPAIMRTVIWKSEEMALEDRISQLATDLSRTVEFYNSSHSEHPFAPTTPAFLTGLLANDTTTSQLVTAAVDRPIQPLASAIECPPDLPLAQYAVNIGLALRDGSPTAGASPDATHLSIVNPNILPEKYRPQQLSPRRILYPVAAVLLVILLFTMYQMKTGSESDIANMQAELESVNQQISDISQAVIPGVAAISATIDNVEAEANRLEEERESILDALATSGLADGLQTILAALPSGVRLTSIAETANQINLGGDADNISSVANYIVALEKTELFSEVYTASLSAASDSTLVTFSIVGHVSTTQ